MKKVSAACALGAALLACGFANANEKLAQSSGCMTCHAVDKKLIGPSYKEIAQRYRGKGAESMLFEKVKKGGKGNWGDMPMPPNAHVKDEDVKALVAWILAHK